MVDFPYNTTDFAFTLDDKYLSFSTESEDTYFSLKLTVNYYPFGSEVQLSRELEYKIPLFDKQAVMYVGSIIHRYIEANTNFEGIGLLFKTTLVDFEIKELSLIDDTELDSTTLNDIKFIPGYSPSNMIENKAVLTINENIEKITLNGYYNIHFITPKGNHNLEVYINGELVKSIVFGSTTVNNIFTYRFNASEFELAEGDQVEFKLEDTLISKTILLDCKKIHSNVLHYLDDYKQISTFELTGEYSIPVKYKRLIGDYKRGLVEIAEIVKTTKNISLKIATGYLLKTDFICVDAINRSKICWLKMDDAFVELVPVSKKQTDLKSQVSSYSNNLEFEINKISDAQNYSL